MDRRQTLNRFGVFVIIVGRFHFDLYERKSSISQERLIVQETGGIVNHMIDQIGKEELLDEIFHALADSTRREMMRLMAQQGERTVSELAAPFQMSLAAASKHIKVLEHAGLLNRCIQGRIHYCRLNTGSLGTVTKWLHHYE